jgi:hypothetical protein
MPDLRGRGGGLAPRFRVRSIAIIQPSDREEIAVTVPFWHCETRSVLRICPEAILQLPFLRQAAQNIVAQLPRPSEGSARRFGYRGFSATVPTSGIAGSWTA